MPFCSLPLESWDVVCVVMPKVAAETASNASTRSRRGDWNKRYRARLGLFTHRKGTTVNQLGSRQICVVISKHRVTFNRYLVINPHGAIYSSALKVPVVSTSKLRGATCRPRLVRPVTLRYGFSTSHFRELFAKSVGPCTRPTVRLLSSAGRTVRPLTNTPNAQRDLSPKTPPPSTPEPSTRSLASFPKRPLKLQ